MKSHSYSACILFDETFCRAGRIVHMLQMDETMDIAVLTDQCYFILSFAMYSITFSTIVLAMHIIEYLTLFKQPKITLLLPTLT